MAGCLKAGMNSTSWIQDATIPQIQGESIAQSDSPQRFPSVPTVRELRMKKRNNIG